MPQETMTKKQERMMKAAMLRHMEDMSNKEISREIGVTEGTVENYFSDPEMEQFKRFYSDQELFKLQQSLEQDIRDGEQLANNLLARAIQHDDASANTLVRASKLALENRKRKVELLQELGIIDKPGSGSEENDGSGSGEDSVLERLQEAYNEKQQEKQEREAEKVEN